MNHMDNELRDELISAAIDGEPVDVEALRRVLRTDDGRETLAAFVLLRAATVADAIVPTKGAAEFGAMAGRPRFWWSTRSPLRAACAACLAVLAVVGSFWLGTTLREPVLTVRLVAPPAVAAPVSSATAGPTTVAPLDQPAPATARPRGPSPLRALWQPPKPTRTLSFVPGVDWTSTRD